MQKWTSDQNINDSKGQIWNSFFEILFWVHNFFIFVCTFQWTRSEFFLISDFLAESLKANKNQRKISLILQYSFSQKTSFIWWTSTSSSMAMKIICSHNIAETTFQQTCFCLVSGKKIAEIVKYHILTRKNCDNSWNTLKANVCIFLYISVRKNFFQRSTKICWGSVCVGGGGGGEYWVADDCLGLVKCYIFFILIEIFGNSTIFKTLSFFNTSPVLFAKLH